VIQHGGFQLIVLIVIVGFAVAGLAAGAGGRWLLGRLRRGAVFRPPWCELVTGALWAVTGWRLVVGALPWWWLPVPLLLAWFGVALAAVDLARRRLPDALTLPAYPVFGGALVIAACVGPSATLGVRALVGVLVFGGAHAAIHFAAPRSLGAGDVKLAGFLGAVLGAVSPVALIIAAVLAAGITAALACRRTAGRPWSAPHGPGLLAATWLIAVFPAVGGLCSRG